MSKLIQPLLVVCAIGLAAMYFTSANPIVTADQTSDSAAIGVVLVNIVKRLDTVETKLKIKVPEDQQITITNKRP